MTRSVLAGLCALAIAGCAREASTPETPTSEAYPPSPEVRLVATPAGSDSGRPRLSSTPDGGALLSWSEPAGDGYRLRYAVWADTGWASPQTADAGADWFVNWADTPGVAALPNGLVAHTLVRQPTGGYAYDVRVRLQDGPSWSPPVTPHSDGTAAEHGFVSVVPVDGRAGLVWLDGREQAGGHGHGGGPMTLRFATLGADGRLADEAVLDDRTCDCCPTAAAVTPRGPVVAYRDRSGDEVRDIAVVRRVAGVWTEPAVVHADGWKIEGCPVNGPALASVGDRVALAWFTAAASPRVSVAFSDDAAATFGAPIVLDDSGPIGRVAVAALPSGAAVVGWLDGDGEQAVLRTQRVEPDGALGPSLEVARVPGGRATGVPALVAVGETVLVAWTDPEAPAPLRSAVARL